MSDFDYICRKAERIVKRYRDNDPLRLCEAMEIYVNFFPLGSGEGCCKGFYINQSRIGVITINSDLSGDMQRIICAHELGHAVLHKTGAGVSGFHDFSMFDTAERCEYEANIFAAELLLPDEEVLSVLNEDISFFQAAAQLYVPAELLDFKFRTLKWKGYKVIDAPIRSNGNFLKNVSDRRSSFWN